MMYQALDYFMVSQLYNRRKLDTGENKVLDETASKDLGSNSGENKKLDLSQVNIFKTNLARMMPGKVKCRRLLREEEKLFLDGLKKYHK